MSKLKILYVASEMSPFLKKMDVGEYIRPLPEAMQNKGCEVRILVPRFGIINERRNRLHEVVRLSGINISVGEDEKPLVIKVASIPQAKLQVYFIDNEDYFQKKLVLKDKEGNYRDGNHERAIFFSKGIMETVRKLGWAPDIVHCCDWMSGLVPLYIKTAFKNDPLFKESKVVFTGFDNSFDQNFGDDNIKAKALMQDVTDEQLEPLASNNCDGFNAVGAANADVVTVTADITGNAPYKDLDKVQVIENNDDASDKFYDIYQELAGVGIAG